MNSPSMRHLDLTLTQMEACASDLMLNSTHAWPTYDDSTRSRATNLAISLWPHFKEFVRQAHIASTSTMEVDPLNIDLATLPPM